MEKLKEDSAELVIKNNKKRIGYVDIAKGIAIILMIVGHVCSYGSWKRNIIYSFHMPLFIIISGMFFKENESFKKVLIKILKTIIIPYVLAIIIRYILQLTILNKPVDIIEIIKQIIFAYSNKKSFFTKVKTVDVLWFLPFLAMCKILYYLINKFSKGDETLISIISLFCTILGIYLDEKKIYLPWSFDVSLTCMIFFHLGYVLKKYNLLEKILKNYKMIISIILIYFIGLKLGYIELATRSYPNGLISFVTAIAGTIICLKISNLIENFTTYLSNILQWFGKNSMIILGVHYIERMIIPYKNFGITDKGEMVIAKLMIITICTFLLYNIKILLKKRKAIE